MLRHALASVAAVVCILVSIDIVVGHARSGFEFGPYDPAALNGLDENDPEPRRDRGLPSSQRAPSERKGSVPIRVPQIDDGTPAIDEPHPILPERRRPFTVSEGVPISPAGYLGNFNLSSAGYAVAHRFVFAEQTTIDRWYYAMNGEGADCVEGREGYGAGDGGMNLGRIVAVDQDTGLPTGNVLAVEEINACEAYERARDEFGLTPTHQALYAQFPPLTLAADRMYAFVLSNADPDPGDGGGSSQGNHMSVNLNFADLDDMGPHAVNTLDPDAPGAAYGLDPRETTMWSEDSGTSWKLGDQVGWYDTGSGTGRMWPGGYRIVDGPNVPNGWIYMNWPDEGPASVTYTATTGQTLITAGGASSDGNVGVITVENLTTGVTATTKDLTTGLVSAPLSQPVPVSAGQRYAVRTSGQIDTGSAGFWDRIFDLGRTSSATDTSSCENCNNTTDRPMLFAGS